MRGSNKINKRKEENWIKLLGDWLLSCASILLRFYVFEAFYDEMTFVARAGYLCSLHVHL